MALRASIKQSISKQKYDTFAALTFAAKAGDVDIVRDLLRRGEDKNQVDYDGRTAFAMVINLNSQAPEILLWKAANQGSYYLRISRHVQKEIIKLQNSFSRRVLIKILKTDGNELHWRKP